MTELSVSIENVGGIEEASFSFDDSVSLISGANATNKTSLLQAIAFGLGRNEFTIRSNATEASVTLTVGDETVTRVARRSGRGTSISGDAWIADSDDKALFEYFGCLLEFNPIRSTVRRNGDIGGVLKEPVDIETLERRQSKKIDEKRKLRRELDRMGDLEADLREQRRVIEEKREREAQLEDRLESLREQQSEMADSGGKLDALREERADLVLSLENYESEISDLEASVDHLTSEREEVATALEEKREAADQYEVDSLKAERQSIEEEMDDITRRHDLLQSALSANREILNSEFTGVLGQETELLEENFTCWVCGQSATVSTIEETIDQLQELIEQDEKRKREHEPRLEEIDEKISEANEARKRVEELDRRLDEIDEDIENRRESLETKRRAAQDIRDELAELNERIDDFESEQASELTDLTDELEEVQVELQTTRQAIATAEDRVESLEERKRERDRKEEQVEELTNEINDLTDRIENLENHLREEFNEAMDDLVSRLQFHRIERVWLDGELDLVIAREVDGSVCQDSLTSLSESEREVVGLVLALAGYLAYDLEEIAPALLMDTLGALDAERAERLIEYFDGKSEFLIAAMLPENASTLDRTTVKPIEQTNSVTVFE